MVKDTHDTTLPTAAAAPRIELHPLSRWHSDL